MTQNVFAQLESSVYPPNAPVSLGLEGLEQIRRDGMEPFIEKCRERFGHQALGRSFQLKPRRQAEPPEGLSLFRLRDEDAFFLCRGLPATEPERCYIKARKNGQIYYLEETQAPAALGGGYEILYCMLGKELAGAVYDSGKPGPCRWRAIGLARTDAALWLEALSKSRQAGFQPFHSLTGLGKDCHGPIFWRYQLDRQLFAQRPPYCRLFGLAFTAGKTDARAKGLGTAIFPIFSPPLAISVACRVTIIRNPNPTVSKKQYFFRILSKAHKIILWIFRHLTPACPLSSTNQIRPGSATPYVHRTQDLKPHSPA